MTERQLTDWCSICFIATRGGGGMRHHSGTAAYRLPGQHKQDAAVNCRSQNFYDPLFVADREQRREDPICVCKSSTETRFRVTGPAKNTHLQGRTLNVKREGRSTHGREDSRTSQLQKKRIHGELSDSNCTRQTFSVQLHLRPKRTNKQKQTDARNRIWCIFCLKI